MSHMQFVHRSYVLVWVVDDDELGVGLDEGFQVINGWNPVVLRLRFPQVDLSTQLLWHFIQRLIGGVVADNMVSRSHKGVRSQVVCLNSTRSSEDVVWREWCSDFY
jgi:hypothetical protein